MKANRGTRVMVIFAAAALATLAAACSSKRIIPAPTASPTSRPQPARPMPAPQRPAADWRDMPITPGNWVWGLEDGQSVARFAGGMLALRCDRAAGSVTILRSGGADGAVPMTITTTETGRSLTAAPRGTALEATLAARDPLLDAMAFSRGRFMVAVTGLPTLYVPSWPEVSRVIEDCR